MNTLVEPSGTIGIWQVILLATVLLPIAALISILKNDFKKNDKLIWILVALFLPFFGSILYFIIGRSKRIKNSKA